MFNRFFKSITDLFKFFKTPINERQIVFYSENKNSYEFFEGLINELLLNKYKIFFITSDYSDPILKHKNISSFYIGSGSIRTVFFQFFNSNIMILTMPDLDNTYIKKSKFCKNYIYVTHNICSIHMVFRKKAFNHYDTFFCVGPHHNKELEETEKLYSLNIKKINFGYYKIDKLMNINSNRDLKIVVLAPSWGKNSIIEKYGDAILYELSKLDWKIIIRPHPDTLIKNKKKYNSLKKKFSNAHNIEFHENVASMNIYLDSSIMISDWSGAAFEFALGLEKPVIFIDVPKKINNEDFKLYNSIPFEVNFREKIGKIIEINQISKLNYILEDVFKERKNFQKKINIERNKVIYNLGNSSHKGFSYLESIIK
jgi:hypothetical protein